MPHNSAWTLFGHALDSLSKPSPTRTSPPISIMKIEIRWAFFWPFSNLNFGVPDSKNNGWLRVWRKKRLVTDATAISKCGFSMPEQQKPLWSWVRKRPHWLRYASDIVYRFVRTTMFAFYSPESVDPGAALSFWPEPLRSHLVYIQRKIILNTNKVKGLHK